MYSFYNVDYAVINEYWVRAFAIRFMEKMRFDDFDVNEEYVRQRKTFLLRVFDYLHLFDSRA